MPEGALERPSEPALHQLVEHLPVPRQVWDAEVERPLVGKEVAELLLLLSQRALDLEEAVKIRAPDGDP